MLFKLKSFFIREKLLSFLILFLLLLLLFVHPHYKHFMQYIDWNTIYFLSGLLLITTAMKESNYFYYIAKHVANKIHNKKTLSYFLILLSSGLATFLTNDIALFLIIPFTLELKKIMNLDVSRIILLEILSVNIGSSLTPIGNPQNVFLWHHFRVNFFDFIIQMFPIFIIQMLLLLFFAYVLIEKQEIQINLFEESYSKLNFYSSVILLIIFIIISKTIFLVPFLILIFSYFFIFNRTIIFKSDWNLIITFILFFIDFGIVSHMNIINTFINKLDFQDFNLFSFSVILSQFISNVPATILISHFSDNWKIISFGVNVGGAGLIIGSLANIIGLRLAKIDNGIKKFHKISFPFIIISFILISLFLVI